MKKLITVAAIVLACIVTAHAAPSVISESAVLIDADTGQVLYDKAMHAERYPASITKIATVITGLERGSLSDTLVMSEEAVFGISRDSSHIALDVDEEITLEQASYAALMMSANDACNGIAEHVGGTIDGFVSMMNETMKKAGAKNTTFTNAHGLKDPAHITTAYDMAMICRYAIKNDDFRKIFGTYKYDMPPNNEQPETRHFVNQHEMISNPEWMYDGIIGGKAGWTSDADYTLVTAAERNGITLIAVVMKSPRNDDKYTDTKTLLDWGFESFQRVTLKSSDLPRGSGYTLSPGSYLLLPKDKNVSDISFRTIMENGQDLAVATLEGAEIARLPCTAAIDASAKTASEPARENTGSLILKIALTSVLIIIGAFALLCAIIAVRKEIHRARRRRARRRRK